LTVGPITPPQRQTPREIHMIRDMHKGPGAVAPGPLN